MHFNDKLTIDDKRRTRDGYLTVNARVARAGNVQVYTGAEAGRPDLATVRVFRPADEVFSQDTMKSFAHRPVTLGHPDASVTTTNWSAVAKGWTDGEVMREGEFVRVSMLLADAATIAAVENGTRELSMGYDCSLDFTAGTSPSGEAFDAVQRGIRSNHVAVVQKARGGSDLRIGDIAPVHKPFHTMTDGEKQTMRDSVRGMPLDQAAALPIYDDVRGASYGGMPAEQYFAIVGGAVVTPRQQTADQARRDAAYDQMVHNLNNAHRGAPATPATADEITYARDGRPMSSIPDNERAREEYVSSLSTAWHR